MITIRKSALLLPLAVIFLALPAIAEEKKANLVDNTKVQSQKADVPATAKLDTWSGTLVVKNRERKETALKVGDKAFDIAGPEKKVNDILKKYGDNQALQINGALENGKIVIATYRKITPKKTV